MGVDISIFSNHSIISTSINDRIHRLEDCIGKEIRYLSEGPEKPESIENVIYYIIPSTNREEYFNQTGSIGIQTNYSFFSGMYISDKVMELFLGGNRAYYWWHQYLGDEYQRQQRTKAYLNYNKKWSLFRDFQYDLIRKLGGDKVLYFADCYFEEEIDLIYSKNKSLEEVISEMGKVGTLYQINQLYNEHESIYSEAEGAYGFYEKIDNCH